MKPSNALVLATALGSALGKETSSTKLERRNRVNGCTAITPPPADIYCGQTATRVSSAYSSLVTNNNQTLDYNTCLNFCLDMNSPPPVDPACSSFAHDSANNLCSFTGVLPFMDSPYSPIKPDPNSTESFTDVLCFTCNRNCELPRAYNIINNPRFDLSPTKISPWLGFADTIVPYSGQGNMVLLATDPNNPNITPFIEQFIGLCADTDYLLTFDYKFVNGPNSSQPNESGLKVHVGDFDAFLPVLADDGLVGRWQTFSCSFRRPATERDADSSSALTITSFLDQFYNVYVKNVHISQISPPITAKTKGPSLLINGGFETGSVKPWKVRSNMKNQSSSVVEPGLPKTLGTPSSKHKFRFFGKGRLASRIYGEATGLVSLAQTTRRNLTRGTRYVATVEYREFNGTGASLSIGGNLGVADHAEGSTELQSFSRIFSGLSNAPQVFTLQYGIPFASRFPTDLTLFVDNIDIRELA